MYIVIFNWGYRDTELLTDSHGFVKEFIDSTDAIAEAEEWLDGSQYRNFKLLQDAN